MINTLIGKLVFGGLVVGGVVGGIKVADKVSFFKKKSTKPKKDSSQEEEQVETEGDEKSETKENLETEETQEETPKSQENPSQEEKLIETEEDENSEIKENLEAEEVQATTVEESNVDQQGDQEVQQKDEEAAKSILSDETSELSLEQVETNNGKLLVFDEFLKPQDAEMSVRILKSMLTKTINKLIDEADRFELGKSSGKPVATSNDSNCKGLYLLYESGLIEEVDELYAYYIDKYKDHPKNKLEVSAHQIVNATNATPSVYYLYLVHC